MYDLIIVDEAHRLTKRKNLSNYAAFDRVNHELGLDTKKIATQLDWIEHRSKHMILYYDRNQTIKPTDIDGSKFASIDAHRYSLSSQFRVKAGRDYPNYIENVFFKMNTQQIKDFGEYDLKIFDDVDEMIQSIKLKNEEMGLSRNVAGYCWPWASKKRIRPSLIFR